MHWPTRRNREKTTTSDDAYRKNLINILDRRRLHRDSGVHPETRKPLERALDRVVALEGDKPDRDAAVSAMLASHGWLQGSRVPSEEQAWLLADSLQALWIRTADGPAIDAEFRRQGGSNPPSGMDGMQKRAWLLSAHTRLQRAGAYERARAALRAKYLRLAGGVLIGLVAISWIVAWRVSPDREEGTISLCALAGALGGALSGARSLRDSRRIQETRIFQTWWWVQPVVGAAVGLFVYALLASSVLTLPGSDSADAATEAAARIVYAFLAGFSEPWILGIMDRLGGTADRAATAAASPPASSSTPSPAQPDADKTLTTRTQTKDSP